MSMIEVHELTKSYDDNVVVDNVLVQRRDLLRRAQDKVQGRDQACGSRGDCPWNVAVTGI